MQISALGDAYVTALGARETVRYAEASLDGLARLLDNTRKLQRQGEASLADVERIRIQHSAAQIALDDAREGLLGALRDLGPMLGIPLEEAEALTLGGSIADRAPPPPAADELIAMSLGQRPDLAAIRLGIGLAELDLKRARAERLQDVYLLYQPYTFQDNSPYDRKSTTSWALGITIPLPINDRNQGNIQRAQVNISQVHTQLAAAGQRVAAEVRRAEREYTLTRAAVERIEQELLPGVAHLRDETFDDYLRGEADLVDFLVAQREYSEFVRQYRDAQIRHRRSMLALNTAVGTRILP